MVKEWICKEEPLIRSDGASVGVGFRQMVELVRCKDCKWYREKGFCKHPNGGAGNVRPADWFCADGERKEGR